MKPAVVVALPFLSRLDAVSNDARRQRQALAEHGYDARLYAELKAPGVESESIGKAEVERLIADPSTVLVVHMCVFWAQLDELLGKSRCKVVLRYHNITPPRFFDRYDREGAFATREGLRQMERLFHDPRLALILVNSAFTLEEASAAWGAPRCPAAVLAPMMDLPEPRRPAAPGPKAGPVELLFVGRWAPNKGHRHLLGVLTSYRELYGDDVRLTVVGKISPNFRGYHAEVMDLAERLGLLPHLLVREDVDADALVALYTTATALLLLSEHEGFCVPVAEAQCLGAPVLALKSSAVADTVGPEALGSGTPDYDFFAAAARAVHADADLRARLVAAGQANAERFRWPALARALADCIDDLCKNSPRSRS